jgi:hypothetical protein
MMRPTPWRAAEPYRMQPPGYESCYGDTFGSFLIPYPRTGVKLHVIATDGPHLEECGLPDDYAWEHVSVSLPNRCPNWPEMDFVKRLFWADDEIVMQLHVARGDPAAAERSRMMPDIVAQIAAIKHEISLYRPTDIDPEFDAFAARRRSVLRAVLRTLEAAQAWAAVPWPAPQPPAAERLYRAVLGLPEEGGDAG